MKNFSEKFHLVFGSWFYLGAMPIASGTWGSLGALPFAWLILYYTNYYFLAIAAGIVFLIGIRSSNVIADKLKKKDPGLIVVDEVAGQWITLVVAKLTIPAFLLGFFLFRFFDILKPYPASWADKKLKGGLGVMLDDIFAGIYGAICLYLIQIYWYPEIEQCYNYCLSLSGL